MQVTNLIKTIEDLADPNLSADWDNSGIQVAGSKSGIKKLAVALDPTQETITNALNQGADFILTHHPLSITPKLPNKRDKYNKILKNLFQSDAWLYSAHTSLDVQTTGPVAWLARELELFRIQPVEPISPLPTLKLQVQIGDKAEQVPRNIRDIHPEVEISPTDSDVLDIYCSYKHKNALLHTLNAQAGLGEIQIQETYNPQKACGYGIIGELSSPVPCREFDRVLSKVLNSSHWTRVGQEPQCIQKVSYCPGSGMDLAPRAFALGADVYISGDLKFHQAQDLEEFGLTFDVGHFVLEEKMMHNWYRELQASLHSEDIQICFIPGSNPLQ